MRDNDNQWWQYDTRKEVTGVKRTWLNYTLQKTININHMPEIDLPTNWKE
jgi:hypothetical protein